MLTNVFKSLPIRKFLFLTYGGTIMLAFGIVLGICAASIYILASNVINESKTTLVDQIQLNSQLVAEEAGRVFEATMDTGLRSFVLPAVYAVLDKDLKAATYSVHALVSYPDSHVNRLKQPTKTDARYSCLSATSSVLTSAQVDAIRGCQNSLQQISHEASSVYLENFDVHGNNIDVLMGSQASNVNVTSVIDDFVRQTWSSNAHWVESFVAMTGLYRQFPGVVGDLAPYSGPRTYSPHNRGWYKNAQNMPSQTDQFTSMTIAGVDVFSVSRTAPYWDKFGKGFLVPQSVPIHRSPSSSGFLGVAGTDLQVGALTELTQIIKLRETGVAHLFEISEGTIVASPQWNPSASSQNTMQVNQIRVSSDAFLTDAPDLAACRSRGKAEIKDMMVVYMPVLDGQFCIATVAPMKEVLQPIADQESTINSTADGLFASSLLICVIAFVLVMLCTFLLAMQLSQPLIATSQDTSQMVNNIGSDLFEGVRVENLGKGIGEVAQLREGFVIMMHELMAKREEAKTTVAPLNPLYQAFPLGVAAAEKSGIKSQVPAEYTKGTPGTAQKEGGLVSVSVGKWNRVFVHLVLKLILPMSLALLAIILVTTIRMSAGADEWISPVKASMLKEELSMLDIRAVELSKGVSELMGSYVNTLHMVRGYSQRIFRNELDLGAPYASHFSPSFQCSQFAPGEKPSNCLRRTLQKDQKRLRGRSINLDSSVWYAPVSVTAPGASHSESAKAQQEGKAAHLDNVARVAYYSSQAPYIYFGFEATEVYRQYPYEDLESFVSPIKCANSQSESSWPQVSGFTPLCRLWYHNAKKTPNTVSFNPVATDVLGVPFVSLSISLHNLDSSLLGVAAVDANLGALQDMMSRTKLYERGYAYLYDQSGYSIVHKNIAGRSGNFRVEELEAGADDKFKSAFVDNVLSMTGKKGTWVFPWRNPDTNRDENWYYSFLPVPGTPYQLVLTVVDAEVESPAQKVQDSLSSLIGVHSAVTIVIFLLSAGGLIYFSLWFNRTFVVPLTALNKLICNSRACGYAEDVNQKDANIATSAELRLLFENFRKVLVALRLGNPAYSNGKKDRELRALRDARTLVESTCNQRGIGVCLNNLGLLSMGIHKAKRADHIQLLQNDEQNPVELLSKSVANARGLQDEGIDGISADTVGQRLLGLALAQLQEAGLGSAVPKNNQSNNQPNDNLGVVSTEAKNNQSNNQSSDNFGEVSTEADAAKGLEAALLNIREAIQIHESSGNWAHLARLAYVLSSQNKLEELPAAWLDAIRTATDASSRLLRERGCLKPEECMSAAQLSFALAQIHRNPEFVHAALATIPHLETSLLLRLAKYAKSAASDAIVQEVDARMHNQKGWKNGPVVESTNTNKALLFVLDASGSMAGSYLNTCKSAIRNILDDFTSPEDLVGFLAFAHYTKQIFDLMPKGGNEELMQSRVQEVQTFGATAFYDAVLEGLEQLKGLNGDTPKWLVTLTDGADGNSKRDKISGTPYGQQACDLLSTGDINIAIITVGNLPHETIEVVSRYVDAAHSAGNQGLHIVASDSARIAEAFEAIANLMADDGLAEQL